MNELKKDGSYKNLQAKLNNLLQLNSTDIFFSSTFGKAVKKSSTRDYYDENTTIIPNNKSNKDFKRENRMDLDKFVPFLNKTQLQEGISSYKMSLPTAAIVVIVVIILTCCCTLYTRNKLMSLVHRLVGKKTKDRQKGLLPVDLEKGKGESKSGSTSLKKLQKIETKPTTEDVTYPASQQIMTTTSSVQAKPSSTACCRCFKKKKKKTRKKHKR